MTFFDFRPKDIISTVYTTYPTRSVSLDTWGVYVASGYNNRGYIASINLYDTGSTPGRGSRSYYDINGRVLTQSFYSTAEVKMTFNVALSSSYKSVVNRLRNTYFSSTYYKQENYGSSSLYSGNFYHVMSISNTLIGSGIKPGSFSFGMITDDGYGGLFSGSKLVGCIFYEYGVAAFASGTQYGLFTDASSVPLYFSATVNTPMNVYICEAPRSMLNFSLNPSYTVLSGTKYEITTETPETFITTIGLYDEDYELVGVAKVANPIHNQETQGVSFRLKLNF